MKVSKPLFIIFLLNAVGLIFTSCSTVQQTIYFQGDTLREVTLPKIYPNVVSISQNDILGITIGSINEEANKLFELPVTGGLRYASFPNIQTNGTGMQPIGYQVDSLGFVELPMIGKVKVSKLTCSVAADTIRNRLNLYLKTPSVNVRILNHRFTILGEVNKPATYNIVDDNLTITEALGMAGDLTIYGKRSNILLIREYANSRVKVRLNLLSSDLLNSPYYYVRNGDVIYIEPSDVRSTFNDRSYQLVPIITSVVSAVTSLGVLVLSLSR